MWLEEQSKQRLANFISIGLFQLCKGIWELFSTTTGRHQFAIAFPSLGHED
jgi:hypothetical protein